MKRLNSKTNLEDVVLMARADGFDITRKEASAIRKAYKRGALAWLAGDRIWTTDESRLTIFATLSDDERREAQYQL